MEDLRDILRRLSEKATTDGFRNGDVDDSYEELSDCEVCGGRGWYTLDVPVGRPEFGQTITCRCKEEQLQDERQARLLKYSNLGALTRFTFEALDPDGRTGSPENQRLFRAAHDAAMDFSEHPSGWLVLTGPHGSGKTHLAASASNRLISNGFVVFFVHVPELLDHLRAAFSPSSETTYSDLFDQVRNTPILVMDDLGSRSTTPWALEKLQQLVNHRYNAELPTVITTATALDDLEPYLRVRMETPRLSKVLDLGQAEAGRATSLGSVAPEMARRMSFENFDAGPSESSAGQRASLDGALRAAQNYADEPEGWLTFFGATGVGKTHLAVAIANRQITSGKPVFYAFVPELMDYLRHAFNPNSGVAYDRLFDDVKNAPLLILDDLGQEHSTPWAAEKLYQIIVHRHNARLPTVITTTSDFTNPTGPISSRVQDPSIGVLVRIDALDYRNKQRGRGRRTRLC